MRKWWRHETEWTKTIGNDETGDSTPVFFSKTYFKKFGFHIDLHKFVKEDKPGCFHSHPAYAIRYILEGGYIEEEYISEGKSKIHVWNKGDFGLVTPKYTHRLLALLNGTVSYSLWLRGPVVAEIMLRGSGWPEHMVDRQSTYKSQN